MNLDLVNQSSAESYLDWGQFFLTYNMLDILLIYLGINFMGVF